MPDLAENLSISKSSNLPLVSVVVGAYNHERYVTECLDSIAASTYPKLELVIFNDASIDSTADKITGWIDVHPDLKTVFIDHETNVGLPASLNEAIGRATGDYVCLIAGDDLMLPSGVEGRVRYLEDHREKFAVFSDALEIDEKGELLSPSALEGDPNEFFRMPKSVLRVDDLVPLAIVFQFHIPGPVFMCRRQTYASIGPYDERIGSEDFDMYYRLAARGKVGFFDGYVAAYRRHDQSMSRGHSTKLFQYQAQAARANLHSFDTLCKLRMLSHICYWKHLDSRGRLQRAIYLGLNKTLLAVSWRGYLLRRRRLLSQANSVSINL